VQQAYTQQPLKSSVNYQIISMKSRKSDVLSKDGGERSDHACFHIISLILVDLLLVN